MKDITEFKAWLNKEISQYPLIAKSNPLSLNELCYVLRLSGKDFAVCWNNDSGFSCIPSIAESYIPSRDLSLKVKLVDYDSADESEDIEGCLRVEIIRKVIRSSADIEKALEDWGTRTYGNPHTARLLRTVGWNGGGGRGAVPSGFETAPND